MEVLQKVSTTIRFPAFGDDEVELTDPKVTITRDSDGSTVLSEAATTKVAGGEDDIEHFTVALSGAQLPAPDLLRAVWSDGASTYETTIDVVGGFVTSVASIKDRLGEDQANEAVEASREIALAQIEDACGVFFRPRYTRELLNGPGTTKLRLTHRRLISVVGVEVDGAALSEAELGALELDPMGSLISSSAWAAGVRNVNVAYVHGFESYPQAVHPVRDYAAYLLTDSPTDVNQRATGFSNELGSYTLVTPGVRGARFPLPSVNAFVAEFGAPLVA